MSKLPWFRVYHRMIDDERLRLLAFEDRWHFVALLCLKADGLLDDERSDIWERRLAMRLGVQLRELDEVNRRLCEVGLIDANWQPAKWDKLQQRSDSSAERVRKHRAEKAKQKQSHGSRDCYGNGDVTLQKRPREEEEEDKIEPKGSCVASDTPHDDFTFSDFEDAWAEVVKECGLPAMRAGARDRRRREFSVRKRQYPDMGDWQQAFATLRKAKWMHGDNSKGWRCDADDFLDPKKFSRLVEGSYAKTN